MAKSSKKTGGKVKKIMNEIEKGAVKAGKGLKKVEDVAQAIAAGLAAARKEGAKETTRKKSGK